MAGGISQLGQEVVKASYGHPPCARYISFQDSALPYIARSRTGCGLAVYVASEIPEIDFLPIACCAQSQRACIETPNRCDREKKREREREKHIEREMGLGERAMVEKHSLPLSHAHPQVGGGGVYPIADLKDLDGLKLGARNPISMFDGSDPHSLID